MPTDLPDYTRTVNVQVEVDPGVVVVNPTVTWNPSASPVEIELKNWNRDFELGALTEWTAVDALISEADPYAGDYCCNLTATDASITQTLDTPVPVNAVYEFSAWVKRPDGVTHYLLRMTHTDATTSTVAGSLVTAGWQRVYFQRSFMKTDKILASIAILSYEGQVFVDDVFLGIAGEIVTGFVEASQAAPDNLQAEVIARPKGGVLEKARVTTTASYATVVEYTPYDDYKLALAKILISCPEDIMFRLRWNESTIGAEVYVTGGIPFTDWYPWEYKHMRGDGSKKFEIQVKYPTDGTGASCYAELVGESVPWAFNT